MALTKQQKQDIVAEVGELLSSSKLTVAAQYQGTDVAAMQALRTQASENATVVKVIKNRLVKQALSANDTFKNTDSSALTGQLLYAFNAEDEVAPAQILAKFAKSEPQLTFVGAITADGTFIGAEDVKALASLPSKEQLRGQLVGTIAAPLTGFIGVMNANVRSILYVLQARAEAIK